MTASTRLRGGPGRTSGGVRGLVMLGILAFLAFCVIFAPAALLVPAVERIQGAALTGTSGTVWRGSGRLHIGGQERGRLTWSFRPASLPKLFPGADWTLSGENLDLGGRVNLTPGRSAVTTSGTIDAAAINPWLAAYDLNMAGDFQVSDLTLHLQDNRADDARGTLNWSGGRLQYVLSRQRRIVDLPPLEARLTFADGPEATVYADGNATPLLEAKLLPNGYVHIGITKLLTRMLNDPWPGAGPDHAVVLAVEEKIL